MLKKCNECGQEFEAKGARKYCSDKCYKIHRKRYLKNHKYKINCEWCGEEKKVKRSNQRFCSTDCQYEWQRKSKEYGKHYRKSEVTFKKQFENKFPGFKYYSGYTGSENNFKMKCRKCGHIQERNAQCAKPSREKRLSCNKCELRERVANRILSLKQKIIREKKYKIKISKQKEITKKVNKEVEAIKQIKKNHRYYKKCSECGSYFFTNRIDIKTCNDVCKRKRVNRIKYLNRRNKLKENGKINYQITINKLIKKNHGICQICGESVDLNDYFYKEGDHFVAGPKYPSIDHIMPVAKGGTHTWDNVQLAHRDCNYHKSDDSLFEFKDNKLKISI